MTPTRYRAGGAGTDDPLRGRRVLARLDPGRARATAASARSCSATIPTRWCATCRTASRSADADRRRRGVRAAGGAGSSASSRRRRSGSTCRSTCAAPRSSSASGRRCARSRPGATASYAEIAARIGAPKAVRAVAAGLRAPIRSRSRSRATAWCARDGALSGYRWGVERKRALLEREARRMNVARRRAVASRARRRRPRRGIDWARVGGDLDAQGCAVDPGRCSTPTSARRSPALYDDDALFRSRVVMARHGFGRGEYKYFAYPLPDAGRGAAHGALSAARADRQPLERGDGHRRRAIRPTHADVPRRAATRPGRRGRRRCCCSTAPGDYNCLHQDLYGEHVFPLQVAILLSEPGARLHRRRVRADRAAAAHAVARRGRAAAPGRRAWSSRCTTARCRARAAPTASTCATA